MTRLPGLPSQGLFLTPRIDRFPLFSLPSEYPEVPGPRLGASVPFAGRHSSGDHSPTPLDAAFSISDSSATNLPSKAPSLRTKQRYLKLSHSAPFSPTSEKTRSAAFSLFSGGNTFSLPCGFIV